MLSRFRLIPERNGQTDGQTDRQTELLYQYRSSVCWRAITNSPYSIAYQLGLRFREKRCHLLRSTLLERDTHRRNCGPMTSNKEPNCSSSVRLSPCYILVKLKIKSQGQEERETVEIVFGGHYSAACGPAYFKYRPLCATDPGAGIHAVPCTADFLVGFVSVLFP